jgi:predicted NACHT family NTPase
VLKSIEAQHGLLVERARGIYSFCHLTFHEYFTAKEIVSSPAPQSIATALKQLVSHITQKRWREVFLLSVGMLRNADYLLQLMKQQIDQLLAADQQLQAFLTWVSKKSRAVKAVYKLVIVRAFYFDLEFARTLELVGSTLDLSRAFDCNLTRNLDSNLALDLALDRNLALNRVLKSTPNPISVLNSVVTRAINHAHLIDLELEQLLQQLKKQIPSPDTGLKKFELWWENNGGTWIYQLRTIMISKRNFGHDWQFSNQQKEALKQYYEANMLLMECLNTNCYVTRRVRQEIEETLLLPLTEL